MGSSLKPRATNLAVRLDRASLPYYTQLVRLVSESESAHDAQIKKSP